MAYNKIAFYVKQYIGRLRDPQYVHNNHIIKLTQSAPDLWHVLGSPLWSINQFKIVGEQ